MENPNEKENTMMMTQTTKANQTTPMFHSVITILLL